MRELAKSTIGFPWAMSMFGVQQLANVFAPQNRRQQTDRATAAFNSVAHVTEEQLEGIANGVFKVGDTLQRGIVDIMFGVFTLEALNSTNVLRMTCDAAQESAGPLMRFMQREGARRDRSSAELSSALNTVLRSTFPSVARLSSLLVSERDRGIAWQEFQDKWQVVEWVADVNSVLPLPPPGTYVPLAELVERAYTLEPFPALWAVEGLGHYYAETFWERNEVPQNLLTGEKANALPDKSLTMLHAGIGLSFANRLLSTINLGSPVSEIRNVLQQFATLCKRNSREGYLGCALESLGLVTRTLYPEMVRNVDLQLSEIDWDLMSYFWHGVGRAIYISPANILPGCGSPSRAAELSQREAPHELGRLNALAGVAWAVTLVHMRRPELVEDLLRYHGARPSQSGALSSGLSSSLIIRYDTTPNDPFITPFCQYQPDPSDPRLVELWNREVKKPCEDALQHYYGVLKKNNRLGEVFRYQPLPELVNRLERNNRTGRRQRRPSDKLEQ